MTPEEERKPVTKGDLEKLYRFVEEKQRQTLRLVAVGLGVGLILIGAAAFYLTDASEDRVKKASAEGLIENIIAERKGCERLDDTRNIVYRLLTVAIAAQEGDKDLAQNPAEEREQEKAAALFLGLLKELIRTIDPQVLERTPDRFPKDGLPDEIHVNCERAYPVPSAVLGVIELGAGPRALEEAEDAFRDRSEAEGNGGQEPRGGLPGAGEGNPAGGEDPHGTKEPGNSESPSGDGGSKAPPTSPPDVDGGGSHGGGGKGDTPGGGDPGGSPPAESPGPAPSPPLGGDAPDPQPQPNPEPEPEAEVPPVETARPTPLRDAVCPIVEGLVPPVGKAIACG